MTRLLRGDEGCWGRAARSTSKRRLLVRQVTLTVSQAVASPSDCLSAISAPHRIGSESTAGTQWPSQEALQRLRRRRYLACWDAFLASAASRPRVLTIYWWTPAGRALHGGRRYSCSSATRPHLALVTRGVLAWIEDTMRGLFERLAGSSNPLQSGAGNKRSSAFGLAGLG